ncbi:MAG: rod shape-determining protein MreC [Candidatus Portnoybacteria bacterium]|nr:rod shape-determining protein MreC [Candidatus Portnoybacteria bacterium]
MKKAFLSILILIIILVVVNLIPGLNKGLGSFVYTVFSPVGKLFSNTGRGVTGFFQILTSIGKLNKENILLREKNTMLESEIVMLKETQKENDALKSALNISKSDQLTIDVASIIGRDIEGLRDWILINKGTKQGLAVGMTVISPEKALVGRIGEVSERFAKVILVSSKDSNIAAMLESSKTEGLVKRDEKGGIFMDFIPKTEKLELGERIITSGTDNLYFGGIFIGTIGKIDLSDNQIFQKITIIPTVNFSKLEQVLIIK